MTCLSTSHVLAVFLLMLSLYGPCSSPFSRRPAPVVPLPARSILPSRNHFGFGFLRGVAAAATYTNVTNPDYTSSNFTVDFFTIQPSVPGTITLSDCTISSRLIFQASVVSGCTLIIMRCNIASMIAGNFTGNVTITDSIIGTQLFDGSYGVIDIKADLNSNWRIQRCTLLQMNVSTNLNYAYNQFYRGFAFFNLGIASNTGTTSTHNSLYVFEDSTLNMVSPTASVGNTLDMLGISMFSSRCFQGSSALVLRNMTLDMQFPLTNSSNAVNVIFNSLSAMVINLTDVTLRVTQASQFIMISSFAGFDLNLNIQRMRVEVTAVPNIVIPSYTPLIQMSQGSITMEDVNVTSWNLPFSDILGVRDSVAPFTRLTTISMQRCHFLTVYNTTNVTITGSHFLLLRSGWLTLQMNDSTYEVSIPRRAKYLTGSHYSPSMAAYSSPIGFFAGSVYASAQVNILLVRTKVSISVDNSDVPCGAGNYNRGGCSAFWLNPTAGQVFSVSFISSTFFYYKRHGSSPRFPTSSRLLSLLWVESPRNTAPLYQPVVQILGSNLTFRVVLEDPTVLPQENLDLVAYVIMARNLTRGQHIVVYNSLLSAYAVATPPAVTVLPMNPSTYVNPNPGFNLTYAPTRASVGAIYIDHAYLSSGVRIGPGTTLSATAVGMPYYAVGVQIGVVEVVPNFALNPSTACGTTVPQSMCQYRNQVQQEFTKTNLLHAWSDCDSTAVHAASDATVSTAASSIFFPSTALFNILCGSDCQTLAAPPVGSERILVLAEGVQGAASIGVLVGMVTVVDNSTLLLHGLISSVVAPPMGTSAALVMTSTWSPFGITTPSQDASIDSTASVRVVSLTHHATMAEVQGVHIGSKGLVTSLHLAPGHLTVMVEGRSMNPGASAVVSIHVGMEPVNSEVMKTTIGATLYNDPPTPAMYALTNSNVYKAAQSASSLNGNCIATVDESVFPDDDEDVTPSVQLTTMVNISVVVWPVVSIAACEALLSVGSVVSDVAVRTANISALGYPTPTSDWIRSVTSMFSAYVLPFAAVPVGVMQRNFTGASSPPVGAPPVAAETAGLQIIRFIAVPKAVEMTSRSYPELTWSTTALNATDSTLVGGLHVTIDGTRARSGFRFSRDSPLWVASDGGNAPAAGGSGGGAPNSTDGFIHWVPDYDIPATPLSRHQFLSCSVFSPMRSQHTFGRVVKWWNTGSVTLIPYPDLSPYGSLAALAAVTPQDVFRACALVESNIVISGGTTWHVSAPSNATHKIVGRDGVAAVQSALSPMQERQLNNLGRTSWPTSAGASVLHPAFGRVDRRNVTNIDTDSQDAFGVVFTLVHQVQWVASGASSGPPVMDGVKGLVEPWDYRPRRLYGVPPLYRTCQTREFIPSPLIKATKDWAHSTPAINNLSPAWGTAPGGRSYRPFSEKFTDAGQQWKSYTPTLADLHQDCWVLGAPGSIDALCGRVGLGSRLSSVRRTTITVDRVSLYVPHGSLLDAVDNEGSGSVAAHVVLSRVINATSPSGVVNVTMPYRLHSAAMSTAFCIGVLPVVSVGVSDCTVALRNINVMEWLIDGDGGVNATDWLGYPGTVAALTPYVEDILAGNTTIVATEPPATTTTIASTVTSLSVATAIMVGEGSTTGSGSGRPPTTSSPTSAPSASGGRFQICTSWELQAQQKIAGTDQLVAFNGLGSLWVEGWTVLGTLQRSTVNISGIVMAVMATNTTTSTYMNYLTSLPTLNTLLARDAYPVILKQSIRSGCFSSPVWFSTVRWFNALVVSDNSVIVASERTPIYNHDLVGAILGDNRGTIAWSAQPTSTVPVSTLSTQIPNPPQPDSFYFGSGKNLSTDGNSVPVAAFMYTDTTYLPGPELNLVQGMLQYGGGYSVGAGQSPVKSQYLLLQDRLAWLSWQSSIQLYSRFMEDSLAPMVTVGYCVGSSTVQVTPQATTSFAEVSSASGDGWKASFPSGAGGSILRRDGFDTSLLHGPTGTGVGMMTDTRVLDAFTWQAWTSQQATDESDISLVNSTTVTLSMGILGGNNGNSTVGISYDGALIDAMISVISGASSVPRWNTQVSGYVPALLSKLSTPLWQHRSTQVFLSLSQTAAVGQSRGWVAIGYVEQSSVTTSLPSSSTTATSSILARSAAVTTEAFASAVEGNISSSLSSCQRYWPYGATIANDFQIASAGIAPQQVVITTHRVAPLITVGSAVDSHLYLAHPLPATSASGITTQLGTSLTVISESATTEWFHAFAQFRLPEHITVELPTNGVCPCNRSKMQSLVTEATVGFLTSTLRGNIDARWVTGTVPSPGYVSSQLVTVGAFLHVGRTNGGTTVQLQNSALDSQARMTVLRDDVDLWALSPPSASRQDTDGGGLPYLTIPVATCSASLLFTEAYVRLRTIRTRLDEEAKDCFSASQLRTLTQRWTQGDAQVVSYASTAGPLTNVVQTSPVTVMVSLMAVGVSMSTVGVTIPLLMTNGTDLRSTWASGSGGTTTTTTTNVVQQEPVVLTGVLPFNLNSTVDASTFVPSALAPSLLLASLGSSAATMGTVNVMGLVATVNLVQRRFVANSTSPLVSGNTGVLTPATTISNVAFRLSYSSNTTGVMLQRTTLRVVLSGLSTNACSRSDPRSQMPALGGYQSAPVTAANVVLQQGPSNYLPQNSSVSLQAPLLSAVGYVSTFNTTILLSAKIKMADSVFDIIGAPLNDGPVSAAAGNPVRVWVSVPMVLAPSPSVASPTPVGGIFLDVLDVIDQLNHQRLPSTDMWCVAQTAALGVYDSFMLASKQNVLTTLDYFSIGTSTVAPGGITIPLQRSATTGTPAGSLSMLTWSPVLSPPVPLPGTMPNATMIPLPISLSAKGVVFSIRSDIPATSASVFYNYSTTHVQLFWQSLCTAGGISASKGGFAVGTESLVGNLTSWCGRRWLTMEESNIGIEGRLVASSSSSTPLLATMATAPTASWMTVASFYSIGVHVMLQGSMFTSVPPTPMRPRHFISASVLEVASVSGDGTSALSVVGGGGSVNNTCVSIRMPLMTEFERQRVVGSNATAGAALRGKYPGVSINGVSSASNVTTVFLGAQGGVHLNEVSSSSFSNFGLRSLEGWWPRNTLASTLPEVQSSLFPYEGEAAVAAPLWPSLLNANVTLPTLPATWVMGSLFARCNRVRRTSVSGAHLAAYPPGGWKGYIADAATINSATTAAAAVGWMTFGINHFCSTTLSLSSSLRLSTSASTSGSGSVSGSVSLSSTSSGSNSLTSSTSRGPRIHIRTRTLSSSPTASTTTTWVAARTKSSLTMSSSGTFTWIPLSTRTRSSLSASGSPPTASPSASSTPSQSGSPSSTLTMAPYETRTQSTLSATATPATITTSRSLVASVSGKLSASRSVPLSASRPIPHTVTRPALATRTRTWSTSASHQALKTPTANMTITSGFTPSRTQPLAIPPVITKTAVAIAATAGAIGSFSGGTNAGKAVQLQYLNALMSCQFSLGTPLSPVDSPTGVPIGSDGNVRYYVGAAMMNAVLSLGIPTLGLMFAAVYFFRASIPQHGWVRWLCSFGRVRFPSAYLIGFTALVQPTITATIAVYRYADLNAPDVGSSMVLVTIPFLLMMGVWVGWVYLVAIRSYTQVLYIPRPDFLADHPEEEEQEDQAGQLADPLAADIESPTAGATGDVDDSGDSTTKKTTKSSSKVAPVGRRLDSRLRRWQAWWLTPVGHWKAPRSLDDEVDSGDGNGAAAGNQGKHTEAEDRIFLDCTGKLYDELRGPRRWFALVDLSVSMILGFVAPFAEGERCLPIAIFSAILVVGLAIASIILRPFRVRTQYVVVTVTNVITATLALEAVAAVAYGEGNHPASLDVAIDVFNTAAAVAALVKLLMDLTVMLLAMINYYRKRQAKLMLKRRQGGNGRDQEKALLDPSSPMTRRTFTEDEEMLLLSRVVVAEPILMDVPPQGRVLAAVGDDAEEDDPGALVGEEAPATVPSVPATSGPAAMYGVGAPQLRVDHSAARKKPAAAATTGPPTAPAAEVRRPLVDPFKDILDDLELEDASTRPKPVAVDDEDDPLAFLYRPPVAEDKKYEKDEEGQKRFLELAMMLGNKDEAASAASKLKVEAALSVEEELRAKYGDQYDDL